MTTPAVRLLASQRARIARRQTYGGRHFFPLQRDFARAMLQAWEWSLIQPIARWVTDCDTKERVLEFNRYEMHMAIEWSVSDDGSFALCCEATGQNPRVLRRYAGIVEEFRWGDQVSRISKKQVAKWKAQAARELGLAPPVELWPREKISTIVQRDAEGESAA